MARQRPLHDARVLRRRLRAADRALDPRALGHWPRRPHAPGRPPRLRDRGPRQRCGVVSQTRSEAEMGELAAAYWECRQRVATLVAALDGPTASTPVPACPGWSVRDVVAHLTGIVDDALAGRLEGAATDAWTARQVDSRRDLSVARMLSDWTAQAALFEPLLDLAGEGGRQAVADIACHEQDIRGALHRPGARDTSSMRIAVEWVAEQVVS